MKRKLWAVGQAQASSLPTRLHIPLHWGFPTACHLRDSFLQQEQMKKLIIAHKILIRWVGNVAI